MRRRCPALGRVRIVGWVAVVAVLLTACGGGGVPSSGNSGGDDLVVELAGSLSREDAAAAALGVNAFGFDLHRQVAEPGKNTVTSPLSASVLLTMVAAGAGGATADEMVEVLGLDRPRDTRYAALLAGLVGESDVTLSIANSLWAAQRYPFEDDYRSAPKG